MSAYATIARRARKNHRCGWTSHPIKPGDVYLVHTEFPGGDAGYADAAGHPVNMPECAACAERYGRGDLIAARLKKDTMSPDPEPTLDQSYCDVGQHAPRCTGYTQDEADPETCYCDCHDEGMTA